MRELRDRHVDPTLRQLARVRRQLLRGEVDVLLLGDSSCLFGAAGDTDTAMIPELIARELGGLRVAAISGAGYSARQHAEFLRILGTLPVRPQYLVTSVCVRTGCSVHVTQHPTYSYELTRVHLAQIDSAARRIRYVHRKPRTDPSAYDRFHALPVTTRWGGASTIGAFRDRLKGQGPPPWPIEHERALFDYFHGEEYSSETPGIADWVEFGRQVAAYGVPTVSYRTAAPMARGELNFPGEFEAHAQSNIKLVDDAIRSTAGADYQIVGGDLDDVDFANATDATEHFSISGRLKLARAIARALIPPLPGDQT
ncbi:hypothetical protein [Nocardioides cavernaquae]|uniref:SGNH/GDSL hydrolase family protein n=1 Tax=Nocardioides cavernaquae TaxID=2321396 RepID=A0A3A5H3X0_9ACTN|nr:hypothetical protein [Nocardioides cavernaquae]RJS45436.1 hypothetical protein D4739_03830 [Nocardioides cavernaquae]